ncbi:Rieske 2Fe-2S domain-containing protein [Nonomuraea sp. LPB2021202275-12-8]|uniref:Rieske 2Fe-2S domain-containing protein n=1 Tax=Nonomuraea sp. LPB2021202275-12-8 TaxID=3120159 RepID=UPI00300CB16C
MTPHDGWYLLCFESELTEEVSPLSVGSRSLIAVRREGRIRVFDGACPHRGAHLGHGGVLCEPDAVQCPFHGKQISLGDSGRRWWVAEHEVLHVGEAVFVRLTREGSGRGFEPAVRELTTTRKLVAALTMPIHVEPEWVTENAFDTEHFPTVHGVPQITGATSRPGEAGELSIEARFRTFGGPSWQGRTRLGGDTRFFARAFSPTLVLTEIGADRWEQVVITGTVPTATGCVARVAVAVQDDDPALTERLIIGAKMAFEQDIPIWEHLDLDAPQRYDAADKGVIAFREFCAGFGKAAR